MLIVTTIIYCVIFAKYLLLMCNWSTGKVIIFLLDPWIIVEHMEVVYVSPEGSIPCERLSLKVL